MTTSRISAALTTLAVVAVVLAAACGSSSDSGPSITDACASYCTTLTANCTAANVQFTDSGACNTYCVRARTAPDFWSQGTTGATSGDTLACRTTHAGLATADPVIHCPHAGPSGGDTCGSWCENYCDLALAVCTGTLQLYADRATCLTTCAGIPSVPSTPNAPSGNSIQCRINHLGRASAGGAAATTHCPHALATPAAGTPCT